MSYRRGDTAGHAGRLVDHLRRAFPAARVFMDVDTMPPGVDFVKVIEEHVAACDAFVALVGDDWLTVTDREGNRRLDNPEDFIRLELAAALKRKVPLIPVLVEGAAMPSAAELPGELSPLARINALEISDNRWDYDIGLLIASLESLGLTRRPATATTAPGTASDDGSAAVEGLARTAPRRRKRARLALLVGLPALVVALVVVTTLGGGGEGDGPGSARGPAGSAGPLLVDVRTNLDDFDYTGIAHVPEFLTTRPIGEVGPPPNVRIDPTAAMVSDTNRKGRWAWAHQMGAVDATETLLRMTIQGRDDRPVTLHRVDVMVVERNPPPTGSNLSYFGLGSAVSPDMLAVDLDQDPPAVTYIDESRNEQESFTFSVSRTDVQVLNILAGTGTCDCTWVVKLKYTYVGEPGELTIDDGGKPFRTAAPTNADQCHWNGKTWACTEPG